MPLVTITIRTDNAAFHDDPSELARILSHLSKQLDCFRDGEPSWEGPIYDVNGNKVGKLTQTRTPGEQPSYAT